MIIELKEITIRELTKGFEDNSESGVTAYDGKLDVRPPYQREFVYSDNQRDAVINTVINGYPLNVMYWSVREDGTYEIIDGQQRTISVCQYVNGDFSFDFMAFHNQPQDIQDLINDYKLMIYVCSGTPSEKLAWFEIINTAGEKLFAQELLNAVYAGPWVTDAKRYFSKIGCVAYQIGSNYVNGKVNRQDYLEKAIDWLSEGNIKVYMNNHKGDANAGALWAYFQNVITWVKNTFPVYRKEMKGIEWGPLYNEFKDIIYDAKKLEKQIQELIEDEDVGSHKGIYTYILTDKEKHLNLRPFDDKIKRRVYERQKGICAKCKEHFPIEGMEADHIKPWHEGGKTDEKNCQLLCRDDNRRKSGK